MIWTIRDLKKKARKLLKNCYWPAVAVCLLTTMLTGWIGSAGIGIGRIQAENASGLEMSEQRMRELKDDLKDRNPIAEYKISIVQKQLNLATTDQLAHTSGNYSYPGEGSFDKERNIETDVNGGRDK